MDGYTVFRWAFSFLAALIAVAMAYSYGIFSIAFGALAFCVGGMFMANELWANDEERDA